MIEPEHKEAILEEAEIILKCKDHLVSQESFSIREAEPGILCTYPIPENLAVYYESENYISHTDSNETLQDRIYQYIKSKMFSRKAQWIEQETAGCKLLDYGAGTGDFLNFMQNRNWNVVGVEPNENARSLALEKGIGVKSELDELENTKFDVITLWHVLEHIPNYKEILTKLKSRLNKNGLLVIAVPNYKSYDAFYYQSHWAAWDVPRHLWHFSRDGISKIMESHDLIKVCEKPLIFDSFYVSLLSEKNQNASASKVNAFWRGLISNLKARSTGEYSSIAYFYRNM
ncbi:class I SAM-dependent methyltransferase [Christiangramia portivictoriae]|uniref:class I SAM-dependent methyltransferase n=1 Tax=Christiangramia portivictoriae TaxID=326069 RepID=UPI00040901DC|nr:class I SAM-dependent methyltransferase [Christiangramia portivictoriae]